MSDYRNTLRVLLLRGGEAAIRKQLKKDEREALIRALYKVADNLDHIVRDS